MISGWRTQVLGCVDFSKLDAGIGGEKSFRIGMQSSLFLLGMNSDRGTVSDIALNYHV
jgi:hypothetical protein